MGRARTRRRRLRRPGRGRAAFEALDELEAVADRIVGIEAPGTGHRLLLARGDSVPLERRAERLEVAHEERGIAFVAAVNASVTPT